MKIEQYYINMSKLHPYDEYLEVDGVRLKVFSREIKSITAKTEGGYAYTIAKKMFFRLQYNYQTSREYYPSDYPFLFTQEELRILKWVRETQEYYTRVGDFIRYNISNPEIDIEKKIAVFKREHCYQLIDGIKTINEKGEIINIEKKSAGYTVTKVDEVTVDIMLTPVIGVVRSVMEVTTDDDCPFPYRSYSRVAFYDVKELKNIGYKWECEIEGKKFSGIKWIKTLEMEEYRSKTPLSSGVIKYENYDGEI